MKIVFGIFLYHLTFIGLVLYLRFFQVDSLPLEVGSIWIDASLFGLLGSTVYCSRSLYLQYCVKKEWDNRWIVWHVIRPFVSTICGLISLLFIKAGFLVFDASSTPSQSYYGIYAVAFIAGMNVDNFIKKIESLCKEILGIQKTRTSREENKS